MHVIPFLTFGDPTNMQHLISHFAPYLDFSAFDSQHSPENALYLDCFSVVANGISVSIYSLCSQCIQLLVQLLVFVLWHKIILE